MKSFLCLSSLCVLFCFSFLESYSQCNAKFSYDDLFCIGETTVVSNLSKEGIYFVYDWGDGSADTINTLNNVTHKYSSTGSYHVKFLVVDTFKSNANIDTCRDSVMDVIDVVGYPSADYSFSPTDTPCASTKISFNNNSSGSKLSYYWDFGGQGSSSSKDPNKEFAAIGNSVKTYNVVLTVTDKNGCSTKKSRKVSVKERPDPVVTAASFKNCQATIVNDTFEFEIYNSALGSIDSFHILWGDTINGKLADTSFKTYFSLKHTYIGLSTYPFVITAYRKNGCNYTRKYDVINETSPSVSLTIPSNSLGCAPQKFTFRTSPTDVSSSTIFYWIFAGRDTVRWDYNDYLNHYNPSTKEASIDYTFDTTSCKSSVAIGSKVYDDAFDVEIIAVNACYSLQNPASSAIGGPIRICQKPNPDFAVKNVGEICALIDSAIFINKTPIDCENSNTLPCNGNTIFFWDLGDGTKLVKNDTARFSHAYAKPGLYTITLAAKNGCGIDTMVDSLIIDSLPEAKFTFAENPSSGCTDNDVKFNNESTGGNLVNKWIIKPSTDITFINSNDADKNPTVRFSEAGNYTVTLIVSNSCGVDTFIDTVNIFSPAEITIDAVSDFCGFAQIFPKATVDTGNTEVNDLRWDFVGARVDSSLLWNPDTVFYDTPGTYTILLTVENKCAVVQDSVIFTVHDLPVVKAGVDKEYCFGQSDTLGDTVYGGGGSYTYQWSPSTSLDKTNILHPFTSAKNDIDYILKVTDNNSCENADTVSVFVNPLPHVSAGVNPVICSGDSALVGDKITGGTQPFQFSWSPSSLVFTPDSLITYTHKLLTQSIFDTILEINVVDSKGCEDADSLKVTVYPSPTVEFVADGHCLKNTTSFTDQTSGNVTSYLWNFGDGGSSSLQNPDHSYADTGVYRVILAVETNLGCKDSITKDWEIFPVPEADFVSSGYCYGDSTAFNELSSITKGNIDSFFWNFGDNHSSDKQNPYHIFQQSGNYEINLTVVSDTGCIDSVKKSITIKSEPQADFSFSDVCYGDTVFFKEVSTFACDSIKAYSWDFDDGSNSNLKNPGHLFASPGRYDVNLTIEMWNGITDSIAKAVTVHPYPDVKFAFDNICIYDSAKFENKSSIISGAISNYKWNFGDVSVSSLKDPLHQYNLPDSYNVQLRATSDFGCSDSLNKIIIVHPKPTAGFSSSDVCFGDSVFFLTTSIVSSGTIDSFIWKFGDGSESVMHDPAHLYSAGGLYQVSHIVRSDSGCYDTASATVKVENAPEADFNFKNVCDGDSISFSDATAFYCDSIKSYSWDFDDGTISSLADPVHLYPNHGDYHVKLVIEMWNGVKDSITKTISVHPVPQVSFTTANVCQYDSASFINTSAIATGSITSFYWDFGDNGTSSIKSPKHQYGNADSFLVALKAESDFQCMDSTKQWIYIHPVPSAGITTSDICFGDSAYFTSVSSVGFGAITDYQWDFGDGQSAVIAAPSHFYQTSGTFNIEHVVKTDSGCYDTSRAKLVVESGPKANFTFSNVCESDTAYFTDKTNFKCDSIKSWQWTFGDGNGSAIANPVHKYAANGSYNVKMVIKMWNGVKDSITKTISVHPVPQVSFTTANVCQYDSASFINTSAIATGSITSFYWDFGDNGTSSIKSPKHQYGNADSFWVALKAESDFQCMDSTKQWIYIHPVPSAGITTSDICFGDSAYFTSVSSVGFGAITDYQWDFGDGQSEMIAAPSHFYQTSGTFNIEHVVKTDSGCYDTATAKLVVESGPKANFTFSNVCESDTAYFTDKTNFKCDSIKSWQWTFGDGNGSAIANPVHKYASYGSYDVKMVIEMWNGVKDSITKTISVHPVPQVSFTTANICQYDSASFINTSAIATGSITSFYWDFGDNGTSSIKSPKHQYGNADSFLVALKAESDFQCIDSTKQWIYIHPVPSAGITTSDICFGDSAYFTSVSSVGFGAITDYQWDFGDGQSAMIAAPSHFYQTSGTFNIEHVVKTDSGCYDTATAKLVVENGPKANFTFSNVCESDSAYFTDKTNFKCDSIKSWQWTFGDGNSSAIANPVHKYAGYGQYNVQLTIEMWNGVQDSIKKVIAIHPVPKAAFAVANQCLDDTSYFQNHSSIASGSIDSFYWNFGDGDHSVFKNPSHLYDTNGVFSVTLKIRSDSGCFDDISKNTFINARPAANFSVSNVCYGDTASFKNLSSINYGKIDSFAWDFDNGDHASQKDVNYFYSNNGNYRPGLTAVSDSGCIDTTSKKLVIYQKPFASFSIDTLDCKDSNIVISNNSQFANSYQWIFDHKDTQTVQNPIYAFSDTGVKDIILYTGTSFGCSDTAIGSIEIITPPVLSYSVSPDSGCAPLKSDIINASTGKYLNYQWDMGNGNTYTVADPPSQTYLQSIYSDTTYHIELKLSNYCGFVSLTKNVFVRPQPIANFGAHKKDSCTPFEVQFQNISIGSPDYYIWEVNDTLWTKKIDPGHYIFKTDDSTTRIFDVKLTAVNQCGSDDTTIQIKVRPKGVKALVGLDPTFGCEPLTVKLRDLSKGATNVYYWLIDEKNDTVKISSGLREDTSFALNSGDYDVVQLADNGCGFDRFKSNIQVWNRPQAQYQVSRKIACEDDTIGFKNFTKNINALEWKFDNGSLSSANSVIKSFDQGIRKFTLSVWGNEHGCKSAINDSVEILPKPSIGFVADTLEACQGVGIAFEDTTESAKNWKWEFSDGINASNTKKNIFRFDSAGTVSFSLAVENTDGCRDTLTSQVVIHPNPRGGIGLSDNYACDTPFTLFITDQSVDGGKYFWDDGNGKTSSFKDFNTTYENPGSYTITHIISSQYNCYDTVYKNFTVHENPKADFDVDTNKGCVPSTIQFNNLSLNGDSYHWDFGDGNISTDSMPDHSYDEAGSYSVKLVIENDKVCKDSLVKNNLVRIHPLPSPVIVSDKEPDICDNDSIALTTQKTYENYSWTDGSMTRLIWVKKQGSSGVEVVDSNGCVGSANFKMFVKTNPAPVIQRFCFGLLQIKDTFDFIKWSTGSHNYFISPKTEGWYRVKTQAGACAAKDSIFVGPQDLKKPFLIPNAFTANNDLLNDTFKVFTEFPQSVESYELKIFNRWGQMVFSTTDINKGWDGTYQGIKRLQSDVYVYRIKVQMNCDVKREYSEEGHVHLLR